MGNFTETRKFKVFMKYLYGMGAAVVLVGALFKLTHWPGATLMLTIGLLTEAGIFVFSSFEPLHEELDWTLVYPELAGLGGVIDSQMENTGKGNLPVKSTEALDKFNKMIEDAGDTNLFAKFGDGIKTLNDKVSNMSDITDATLATNEYSENMKQAAGTVSNFNVKFKESAETVGFAVDNLAESYSKSVESINYSSESLSDSFTQVAQKVSQGGSEFTDSYKRLTDSMDLDFSSLQAGNSEYNEHIGKLNKNLTALNAIFELQLNEADLDKMMEDLQGSVKNSKIYSEEITKLGHKLQALNTVYGNMLTAMNVKSSD